MKKSHLIFNVILMTLCAFSSCKRERVPAEEFAPYISGYTGGLISPSSTIWIELVNEVEGAEPNTEIEQKLFSFSPSIKGKAYWTDKRTIEFVPEESELKSGQVYEAEFKLGKIIEVEKRLRIFDFSFKVDEQNFSINIEPLDIPDPAYVTVRGEVNFSDDMELDLVKKAFSAKTSDKQSLSPIVESTGNNKVFRFVIDKVQRQKTDITLEAIFDGTAIGIDRSVSQEVVIPALDVFKVLSAELVSEPDNGILVTFSDPLLTSQDLKGLVTLSEVPHYTFQRQNNKITIFFERGNFTSVTLKVDKSLKNSKGEILKESFEKAITIKKLKPCVELLKSGNIIPGTDNLILPIRVASLKAVDLKIIRIYENNVLMFLQKNLLDGSNEIRRAGRLVYKKTIRFDDYQKNQGGWHNYTIDLSTIFRQEPGAIYRIELSFKEEYSTYCGDTSEDVGNMVQLTSEESDEEDYWDKPYSTSPYSYSYDSEYWQYYDWEEKDNPCDKSYYIDPDKKVSCNVLMSNIGVIAKSDGNRKWWVSTSNLLDTKPVSGAEITIYNYQLQPIATAKTDGDGFAVVEAKGKAFVLVASANGQKTYLRLADGEDNSLSRFDVGGKKIEKGLKGFIYGERGVWRPGDTLHLSFILYDPKKQIPDNHPVSLELYNPMGQFAGKQILNKGINGFYAFAVPTSDSDPTGLWNAYAKAGGTSFHKSIRIETIKPNRLKINFKLPSERIDASAGNIPAALSATWLTGSIAGNLNAKVEMTLSRIRTQFKGYEKYIFDEPRNEFSSDVLNLFEGKLDEQGEVKFFFKTPRAEDAAGMLNANIVCRVFEPGGDASIYTENIPYSPYKSYVGINLNQREGTYIETDTQHKFDVVTVNADGRPTDRDNLEYNIYRLDWSWWWDMNADEAANYVQNSSITKITSGRLKTTGGKASFNFSVKYPEWGRYLIYVKDRESGHTTGGVVYIDWPGWLGRADRTDANGVKMLAFSTSKPSYEIGEEVTVVLPKAAGGGSALVVLENGSAVLSRTWVELSSQNDTKYTFKATPDMAPNFYIHVSYLQPHAQTANDLPLRLYGVVPVSITNKESELTPQINMPDVLRPETEFTVEVSEGSGKPMTYTLAIVDDGLLDLTNFKTPNPWTEFYAREALGIRTWDMYDYVMGAFNGKISSMFSVGGDEANKPANTKANRFKPVVKFLGPFTLSKGGKNKHKVTLPVYVGSVRTMVVAGQDGAFGKAEKTTPVRSPLMILSSLPRVISIDEEILLPVNVFAMENSVKSATVKIETTGLLQTTNGGQQSVSFDKPGDKMVYFSMKTGSKTGIEKVTVTATGGGQTSKEVIEIDVRNPNPAIINIESKLLNSGQSADFNYRLTGTADDDWAKLEVSRIPSPDISRRFDFLYHYPHYCSEQLTSRALPLLYIAQFKEVDDKESESIKMNIREAIKNLYGRQLANGGIAYWAGNNYADDWITSYAGSFLVLAKEKGYDVNDGVLTKWKNYQRKAAQNWSSDASQSYYTEAQAYRLYTLALAGAPELGAMNRLKELKKLPAQARWYLAAAYALSGKKSAAEELIFNVPTKVNDYYGGYTYGSSERDEAMILQTLVLLGRLDEAFRQAQDLSKKLSGESSFCTQSTAYALVAMGTLAEKTSGSINFNWTLNGKKQDGVKSGKAVYQASLPKKPMEGTLSISNNDKGVLYVSVASKSKPLYDTLPAMAEKLRLDVSYTDMNGRAIDVSELKQGADFIAVITVGTQSATAAPNDYKHLALTQIIPAGWEIFNERMTNNEGENPTVSDACTYRDVRDDRVLTYFDLDARGGRSKTFKIRLQASYVGSFTLPAVQCEAMYNPAIRARTKAGKIKVIK